MVTNPDTQDQGGPKQLTLDEFQYYFQIYGNLVYDPNFASYLSSGVFQSQNTSTTIPITSTDKIVTSNEKTTENLNNFPTVKTINTINTNNTNFSQVQNKSDNVISSNELGNKSGVGLGTQNLTNTQSNSGLSSQSYYDNGYYLNISPQNQILVNTATANGVSTYTYYDQTTGQYFSTNVPLTSIIQQSNSQFGVQDNSDTNYSVNSNIQKTEEKNKNNN